MRRIRFIRYVVLFFAAGFAWGYVAKFSANKFLYIGHDDPQVQSENYTYEIKRLKKLSNEQADTNEDSTEEQGSQEGSGESSQSPRSQNTPDESLLRGGRIQI